MNTLELLKPILVLTALAVVIGSGAFFIPQSDSPVQNMTEATGVVG